MLESRPGNTLYWVKFLAYLQSYQHSSKSGNNTGKLCNLDSVNCTKYETRQQKHIVHKHVHKRVSLRLPHWTNRTPLRRGVRVSCFYLLSVWSIQTATQTNPIQQLLTLWSSVVTAFSTCFYNKLAEIPGVARDWRQSERIRVINYGIIKKNYFAKVKCNEEVDD
jgi:hypothetical protein